MQKRYSWPKFSWLTLTLTVVGVVALIAELVFRLSSITYDRISSAEWLLGQQAHSWRSILSDPLGAPLLVLARLSHYFSTTNIFWLRLPTVALAIMAIGVFYYIVWHWFDTFTAVTTTILLATSAAFLHVARFTGMDVLYLLAPLVLVAYATHSSARVSEKPLLPLWLLFGLVSLGLYIPGFIWLLLSVLAVQPRLIARPWQRSTKLARGLAALAVLVVLAPLIRAFVLYPHTVTKHWLGASTIGTPLDILHRLINVPYNLFVKGPTNTDLWLGHIPLLPIGLTVLVLLGVYELIAKRRRQAILLASLFVVGWLVSGIGALLPLTFFIGLLFIAIAAGIRHLSGQWFRVFPRNPFAKSIGYATISLFCLTTALYGWHAYFVAWPHNQVTHQVFTVKPVAIK